MMDAYAAKRASFQNAGSVTRIATDATGATTLIANKANWKLYVQRIVINVTTSAAQTATIAEITTNGVLASVPSSPGVGEIVFDYGADGIPVADGEGIDVTLSAAGLGLVIAVEAYRKLAPNTAIAVDTLAAS